ncbi:MAG: alanine dehydrogenase [Sphingobacteriia bacterium 24-36-13]|jgi:alanine dehydrogenase|uniref:alanine dehydrogenase n=1 Tax=Sediminibacterium sp. TaxID=1917865 RepID=UPI000BD1E17C|nr:alanine dehydrogenase [Sediminibacterium sp.]OYY10012.1 MAG: alanine dehydrogenase [Sphingobacteriia bacterium 35-36-14]OYZ52166.1 MAG: alanine dehydrogenase [Sphingobacteriia bacterium 24-36-13]OZA66514.1 MAG: alanine dehydrogenase [Sphingobacteriia bacterium 39-36-14]HQS36159.1 alanine dehydrogenase [Sediminibacterium sp.]
MATSKPSISPSLLYEAMEETLDIKTPGAKLHIGIPKEIAFQENRIALTPDAVGVLVANGNMVTIEHNAGERSHYSDRDYSEAGAQIVYDRAAVYQCPILVKSAPPVEDDIPLLQMNQIIISPIHHSALKKDIIEKMMAKRITALSFENFKDDSGTYPIVRSMSEIAGSAVMLIAGQYLSSFNEGKGVLLGGISGIPPTKVVIIGAGIVGECATRNALAMGASVKVFDNNIYRLKQMQNNLGQRVWTSVLEPRILAKQLKTCEVAVGALSNEYGRAPVVVTEEMVAAMRPNSIIIDVAIDRGGCFETSELTSFEEPTFLKHGVIHYCVPNIPSGFARTASQAISNVLMPLLLEISDEGGLEEMIWHKFNVREGVYLFKGSVTDIYISQKFDLKYTDLNLLIASRR